MHVSDVRVLWGRAGNSCWCSLVFEGAVSESAQNTSSPKAEAEGDNAVEGLQAPAESHPTRKQLKEFMQLLLREFLLGAPNPKQWMPLEVLLEVGQKGHHSGLCCGNRPGRVWAPRGSGMPEEPRGPVS